MALEEPRQAFTENAIGGQFVGKVGAFGHTVAREMEWNAVAIAALEFRGRTVGALSSATARIRPKYRPSGETFTRNLHWFEEEKLEK